MHGVRHVSRRPVAVLVLLTTSFKKKIGVAVSQQQIRRLALSSAARVLFNFKKTKGHGVLVLWPPLSAVPAKNSDAPLAPRSHCILRFFSSVARRSTARPGHFTSFPSLPIQSLVHWGFVVKPNKCEGILSKVTSRFNDDLGLPKCSARVSAVQHLGVTEF